METKTCTACGQEKPMTDFYEFRRKDERYKSSSFSSKCKACDKARQKYNPEAEKAQRERGKGAWRSLPPGTTKRCNGIDGRCHHEDGPDIPADDEHFGNNGRGKFGLKSRCKACTKVENARRKKKKD